MRNYCIKYSQLGDGFKRTKVEVEVKSIECSAPLTSRLSEHCIMRDNNHDFISYIRALNRLREIFFCFVNTCHFI